MAITQFRENYYSFRNIERVYGTLYQPDSPDQAALAAIESKLVEASHSFFSGRYQDAIQAYKGAESLIYTQLNPRISASGISAIKDFVFARDRALFDPLLSLSVEWMNVLPVQQPLTTVRSRIPVDPNLLSQTAALERTGLVSSRLAFSGAADAVADLQLAKTYETQSNQGAAAFFNERALQTDEEAVFILNEADRPSSDGQSIPALAALPSTISPLRTISFVYPVTDSLPALPRKTLPAPLTETRAFGKQIDNELLAFEWNVGQSPPLEQIREVIYESRIRLGLADLIRQPAQPADIALDLPHAYYYKIPLGLAECYHALGDYPKAETYYFQASAYQYLNEKIEAPYLWQRLVILYLDWGNSLFRNDEVAEAADIYQRVLLLDDSVPSSTLYTTASLQPGADVGRTVITNLKQLIDGLVTAASLSINPMVAASILDVHQQLLKIKGGLDFWGNWHSSVPIWTFEYLQSAAINFTQLAIAAERDFINFQERADQAKLTRQQIAENIEQAKAEAYAAQLQADATKAQENAYGAALATANQRASDAADNATDYASFSEQAIVHQAVSAQLAGGDDGDFNRLNGGADFLMGMGPLAEYTRQHPGNWRLEGSSATLSATAQLVASRLNREYEKRALERQSQEMGLAATQAKAELNAAQARTAAMKAATASANLRVEAAAEDLKAFDDQFFTPDVWQRMANTMWRLYRRYLDMAIRTARLMQQAYNFETDQSLKLIKSDYSTNQVKGLLGADMLMADIQSFTYDLITSTKSKPQPIRQTISLAQRYSYLFENQLRKTGVMEFETRIDDFDAYYPGTYAGRIEAVEVEVNGIVPAIGISGTLTNSGISAYRTPASLWLDPTKSGLKYRVQAKETLVISDYFVRQDALLAPNDQRMLRIFQGAGLASTWRLDLPKAINDLDYGALTDVRLTFYYKARFDPELRARVLAQLASYPAVNNRQRGIPLRWIYPDAFFHFQDTGEIGITLKQSDFRRNETQPILTDVGILMITDGSVPASGLTVALSTPTKTAISARTDPSGVIESGTAAGTAWAPLTGGTALGTYNLLLKSDDNSVLVQDGKLDLSPIVNIALILGYSFTPKV